MVDPEKSIDQTLKDYKRLGYSDNWINQRLKSIEIRKILKRMQIALLLAENVAKVAKEQLEAETGRKVVSKLSAKKFFKGQIEDKN